MGVERVKKNAEGLKPFAKQPIRKTVPAEATREGQFERVNHPRRAQGEPIWSGVTGNRFAMPLPTNVKGPIRAREVRIKKGIDGYA